MNIRSTIFKTSQVVACTMIGSSLKVLKEVFFSTVFIDEAAQALEPACWAPITKANRVIFAGDHCQLPPTIKSYQAAQTGLMHTLFEKIIERTPEYSTLLTTQYRMHEILLVGRSAKNWRWGNVWYFGKVTLCLISWWTKCQDAIKTLSVNYLHRMSLFFEIKNTNHTLYYVKEIAEIWLKLHISTKQVMFFLICTVHSTRLLRKVPASILKIFRNFFSNFLMKEPVGNIWWKQDGLTATFVRTVIRPDGGLRQNTKFIVPNAKKSIR